MVAEQEQVFHQPEGARYRVGEQAGTDQPPGPSCQLTRPCDPGAEQHHRQESQPGQQRTQPISDRTNPDGLEQRDHQLVG